MAKPVRGRKEDWQVIRHLSLLTLGVILFTMPGSPATAGEKKVVGTVVQRNTAERTFSVRDGKGVVWNYKADEDAGIALEEIREGDRVSVTIGRPTPPNMITAADRLRKGDRVQKIPF